MKKFPYDFTPKRTSLFKLKSKKQLRKMIYEEVNIAKKFPIYIDVSNYSINSMKHIKNELRDLNWKVFIKYDYVYNSYKLVLSPTSIVLQQGGNQRVELD